MQHTVHMFYKLDYHFYSELFMVLQQLSRSKHSKFYKEKDGSYHCHLLKENGLLLMLKHSENEDGISYTALEIIMNPMRLLFKNEYLKLASMEHCKAIYAAFKRAFHPIKKRFESRRRNKSIKFKLHLLDSYSYKRIDFAVNFCTEHIKLYMKLIKRANIPDGFRLFVKYNESSKRYEPTKHSFYLLRTTQSQTKVDHVNLTINCYNKGEQLKENGLPCDDENAKYTIRFEVQCRYNKVYRIIKDNGLSKQGFSQFLRNDIAEDVLHFYFKKTIGYGNYYTLSKAKDIIKSKRMKDATKEALLATLDLVNEKRGIWKAKETVSDKKEFDKRIKRLHELGINPVTIPVSWGIDYLPCLFDL